MLFFLEHFFLLKKLQVPCIDELSRSWWFEQKTTGHVEPITGRHRPIKIDLLFW
jgi:hypothetical protein